MVVLYSSIVGEKNYIMNINTGTSVQSIDLWIGGERTPPSSGRYFTDNNPENDTPMQGLRKAMLQTSTAR